MSEFEQLCRLLTLHNRTLDNGGNTEEFVATTWGLMDQWKQRHPDHAEDLQHATLQAVNHPYIHAWVFSNLTDDSAKSAAWSGVVFYEQVVQKWRRVVPLDVYLERVVLAHTQNDWGFFSQWSTSQIPGFVKGLCKNHPHDPRLLNWLVDFSQRFPDVYENWRQGLPLEYCQIHAQTLPLVAARVAQETLEIERLFHAKGAKGVLSALQEQQTALMGAAPTQKFVTQVENFWRMVEHQCVEEEHVETLVEIGLILGKIPCSPQAVLLPKLQHPNTAPKWIAAVHMSHRTPQIMHALAQLLAASLLELQNTGNIEDNFNKWRTVWEKVSSLRGWTPQLIDEAPLIIQNCVPQNPIDAHVLQNLKRAEVEQHLSSLEKVTSLYVARATAAVLVYYGLTAPDRYTDFTNMFAPHSTAVLKGNALSFYQFIEAYNQKKILANAIDHTHPSMGRKM